MIKLNIDSTILDLPPGLESYRKRTLNAKFLLKKSMNECHRTKSNVRVFGPLCVAHVKWEFLAKFNVDEFNCN